jgi:hypothetical protein
MEDTMRRLQKHIIALACSWGLSLFAGHPAMAQTGWGARPAQTPVQKYIVMLANAAAGRYSGLSSIQIVGAQGCDVRGWCTDVAPGAGDTYFAGDGARVRAAIKRYAYWYASNPKTKTETYQSILNKMQTIDLSDLQYSAATRSLLAQQIANLVLGTMIYGQIALPSTDNQTLQFLSVQKQCLEWAMTTAIVAGGAARNYSAAEVANPQSWRPGMGLYRRDRTHAMLIVDINWTAGRPIQLRVAEANYGNNAWTNPTGMVPWSRTVNNNRIVNVDTGTYKVVSYE